MSNLLVFLQQVDGVLPKTTLAAVTAAKEIQAAWKKQKLCGVCLGPGAKQAAESARSLGFSSVLYSEDAGLEKYLAAPYAAAVLAAAKELECDAVVAAATSHGKDFMPRVSMELDAAQASDIIGVNANGVLVRPMYAGDVIAEVELVEGNRVVTVRGTAFDPAQGADSAGEVKELSSLELPSKSGEVVGYEISGGDRPDLTDAEAVVSGGRAMESEEKFQQYIFPLADALGAAVGASRAAVDSGYAPNDWQVGQTGKVVAPNLYIAIGISGAIQHLAGMKDSKVIVAINKDPDAPIYEIADYGLVADLYEVVPALTEAIKAAKSQ